MAFSNADVTAYISGNSQRTEEITFKASELQTITMKLPSGVKLHNVTTGKTSSAGASVEICGGTKFYLSAPLTQAVDVKGEWSVTMKGSIIKDYSAYKITTGSETQDLALVFGEGVTDEKYVDFKVSWVKQATLEIVKKDRKSNKAIAGAVYGVYSDKDGKNLITKMPATDANGSFQRYDHQNTGYRIPERDLCTKRISAGHQSLRHKTGDRGYRKTDRYRCRADGKSDCLQVRRSADWGKRNRQWRFLCLYRAEAEGCCL